MSASPRLKTPRPFIALVGMRGSGKTVVGLELARLLNLPFVDTDQEIERSAGRTIAAIFAADGEPAFRALEAEAIRDACTRPPSVVSVGGGAVLEPANVAHLKEVASLVWLRAPVEVLWSRISRDARSSQSRPSLTRKGGLDELRMLLAERESLYRDAADLILDTETATPFTVALAIRDHFLALSRADASRDR